MRNLTLTLLSLCLISFSLSAQTLGGSKSVTSGTPTSIGGMIRSGWASPVYSQLKWVPDPNSATTADVKPERRDAGYWPDMPGGSSQQSGVVLLHFVQGTTIFSKGQDNDRAFAILEHTFYNTALVERMEYITITAAASPEGMTEDNETLAAERALAIKERILEMFPYLERDRIITYSAGEDWNGLKRLIEEDLYAPGRDAALRLLSSPLSGNIVRERLQTIAGGETYAYISEHMFPKLRGGAACLIYFKEPEPAPAPARRMELPIPATSPTMPASVQQQPELRYLLPAEPASTVKDPVILTVPVVEYRAPGADQSGGDRERDLSFEVKTNLLYDLTTTINLGLEFRLGGRTSLDIPVSYNGWDVLEREMWRHVLVQPELRLWTRESFRGHFFGLHAHYSYYNIGNIPTSDYMKDRRFEGSLAGAGISYGYRWNFRNSRWGMEATAGMGYTSLRYDEYQCETCKDNILEKGAKKQWIGPTKVGLNLIYRVGGK